MNFKFKFKSKMKNAKEEKAKSIELIYQSGNKKCRTSIATGCIKLVTATINLFIANPELVVPIIDTIMNRLFYSNKNSFFYMEDIEMYLEEYITNFNKHIIFKLNTKRKLKTCLYIPSVIKIDELDVEISKCYSSYYMLKKHEKYTREERQQKYIKQWENTDKKYYDRPEDFSKGKYRYITAIKSDSWLKPTLKKLNRLFTRALYNDRKPIVPFIHSCFKKRSYKTNAEAMLNYNYVLTIDMANFYPSISREKLYNFFKGYLNLETDISKLLSILCTSSNGIDEYNEYNLGQGLSTSGTLALLLNLSLFEYINKLALEENITMVVYVDDVTFGSNKQISQKFINKLFGLIKGNGMQINKKKFKSYNFGTVKKITGTYLRNGAISVAFSKREEIEIQYKYLFENKENIRSIEHFLDCFVVFQRFVGNINYIQYVEGKTHNKYLELMKGLVGCFPRCLHRIKRNRVYCIENLKKESKKDLMQKFDIYILMSR